MGLRINGLFQLCCLANGGCEHLLKCQQSKTMQNICVCGRIGRLSWRGASINGPLSNADSMWSSLLIQIKLIGKSGLHALGLYEANKHAGNTIDDFRTLKASIVYVNGNALARSSVFSARKLSLFFRRQ
jgi:hypothetical protein